MTTASITGPITKAERSGTTTGMDAMALTKLGIIGAGRVGTAVAVSAAAFGVARTIALYDVDAGRAEAESADLRHGTPFLPPAAVLGGGDPSVLDGSDVLVFAAGAGQRRGQSRLDLAEVNGELC
ncbi:MAG: hypothetical protein AB7Q92_33970, partial [Acidimicrobiia bacterium]